MTRRRVAILSVACVVIGVVQFATAWYLSSYVYLITLLVWAAITGNLRITG